MKKSLLTTVTVLFMSFTLLMGQETKPNAVTLSYGVASTDEIMSIWGDVFGSIVGYSREEVKTSGVIILNYNRDIAKLWSIGGGLAYEQSVGNAYILGNKVGKDNRYYLTIALEGRINYLKKPIFNLYSGLGLGYTIAKGTITYDDKSPDTKQDFSHVNYQITAVGFRVGKDLAGVAEVGFGYKGIANIGVSYRF